MIKSRKTTKNCDVCNEVVAIKGWLRFRTIVGYITLQKDLFSMIAHTDRGEVHICYECWDKMKRMIRSCRGLGE